MIIDKMRIKYRLTVKGKDRGVPVPLDLSPYGVKDIREKDIPPFELKKVGSWAYMCWITLEDCEAAFAFFYGQFGKNFSVDWSLCQIEYNPNKTRVPSFIGGFLADRYAKIHTIVSIDVAFDFKGVPVSHYGIVAHGATEVMTYGTLSGVPARYVRPKANDGRIKIYDKEKEREGKPDAEKYKGVSRVEVTFHDVTFLLRQNFYSSDIDRLNNMVDDLNAVRVPDVAKMASREGLNGLYVDMLDDIYFAYGLDKALTYCRRISRNSWKKYRDYILTRSGSHPVFDGDGILFGLQLSDELLRVLYCA